MTATRLIFFFGTAPSSLPTPRAVAFLASLATQLAVGASTAVALTCTATDATKPTLLASE